MENLGDDKAKLKADLLKSIANKKNGGNKPKDKNKGMFKDKRLNIIVNKIGLSEQDANWCISIHKKYCVWIANQIKANFDLKRREGDINLILDWKKEEQELNLNDYTFDEALQLARVAHGMNFKENNNSLKNKNIVLDLGTYKWVQLLTQEDCKEEGSAMGHCIGGNGHASSISRGNSFAFSLRDEFNRPHLTLEANKSNGTVFEFKGRNNAVPKLQYIECYVELSQKFADLLGQVTDCTFSQGLRKDVLLAKRMNLANKRTFDERMKLELGLNMFEKGELFMQSINVGNKLKTFELPEEIKVYGNLIVSIGGKIIIPKDIVIGGSVALRGKSVTIGNDVKVGGNLEIADCVLSKIPKGLMVCGDLILPKSLEKKEKEIRESIIFGGRLIFGEKDNSGTKGLQNQYNNYEEEYEEEYDDDYDD